VIGLQGGRGGKTASAGEWGGEKNSDHPSRREDTANVTSRGKFVEKVLLSDGKNIWGKVVCARLF